MKMNDENVLDWNLVPKKNIIIIYFLYFFHRTETIIILYNSAIPPFMRTAGSFKFGI
jgi:hypothetical protein